MVVRLKEILLEQKDLEAGGAARKALASLAEHMVRRSWLRLLRLSLRF